MSALHIESDKRIIQKVITDRISRKNTAVLKGLKMLGFRNLVLKSIKHSHDTNNTNLTVVVRERDA